MAIDSDDNSHSSSESDRSHDYASDLDDLVFDDLCQLDDAEPDGNWTYIARSSRGGKIYEGLIPSSTYNHSMPASS